MSYSAGESRFPCTKGPRDADLLLVASSRTSTPPTESPVNDPQLDAAIKDIIRLDKEPLRLRLRPTSTLLNSHLERVVATSRVFWATRQTRGRRDDFRAPRISIIGCSPIRVRVAVAPGGERTVMAENLLLKQQVIVLRRARRRAPNLTQSDRLLCGFWSLFLSPERIRKVAIALRPSTLLTIHQALVPRKYRRLFSSTSCPTKPGPKGPDQALIQAIVELKSRNPRSHG